MVVRSKVLSCLRSVLFTWLLVTLVSSTCLYSFCWHFVVCSLSFSLLAFCFVWLCVFGWSIPLHMHGSASNDQSVCILCHLWFCRLRIFYLWFCHKGFLALLLSALPQGVFSIATIGFATIIYQQALCPCSHHSALLLRSSSCAG